MAQHISLAAASLSFDGFGDADYVNTFEMAPQAGYRWIEFNCWYPRTLTEAKMDDLKHRCEQTGLKPASLHIGCIGGADRDELTKDVCHKVEAMRLAKRLGCDRVAFCGATPYGAQGGLQGIVTVLHEIAPIAETMGVQLCLENHAGHNMRDIDDYRYILDHVSSPNVGICVDTGHFDAAGVDAIELIKVLGDRVNHIHLKENRGFGQKEFTRFFEGTTDNDGIVQVMIEKGYSGFLVVEVSPEIGEHDGRPFTIMDTKKPCLHFSKYIHE